MNFMNTVYDVKYPIGRLLNNETMQSKYCDEAKQFTAEEIPSVVPLEMKETAEAYLDRVTNTVSAVSAYFYDTQCKATIDRVLMWRTSLISQWHLLLSTVRTRGSTVNAVFSFDLGGSIFDVSVISIENENRKSTLLVVTSTLVVAHLILNW
ncbi:unnamed protein product [Taenia asiatica]|uniref:FGGY_N domain-containing protein n=1 Tax=Taenia asiatica TaxID=60517 RepID=A0A0R3WGR6_TAEAS|nr:unnamed protein product [Taenia asiatica]